MLVILTRKLLPMIFIMDPTDLGIKDLFSDDELVEIFEELLFGGASPALNSQHFILL